MYQDKTLICKECGAEFVFTAGEQEFYAEKGFVNEPQRCKACRDARKNNARPEREMFTDGEEPPLCCFRLWGTAEIKNTAMAEKRMQ